MVPMADGGDGTLDTLLAGSGSARCDRWPVHGPLGGRLVARLGWIDATTAIVELAEAAGLRRLGGRREPLRASSRGAGDLIRHALDGGASRILVGIGGSACSDGGAGLLSALGARLLDARGRRISDRRRLRCRIWTGPSSAASTPGSAVQRRGRHRRQQPAARRARRRRRLRAAEGGDRAQVELLEAGSAAARRGAGARRRGRSRAARPARRRGRGGHGYGLAVTGARLLPGAALVADVVGLDAAIAAADLVITGEGRLDSQTAAGKAPIEVARRSARQGVPCIAVAGSRGVVARGTPLATALSLTIWPGRARTRGGCPDACCAAPGARIVREAVSGG